MALPPVVPLQFGALPTQLQRVFVVVALLAGAAVALGLDDGRLYTRLRERFVLGVPWGTLVTVLGVLAVYLFLQGGYWHWRRPLVIPFRAWSYLEPLGMLVAGFAHAGPGHLLGNLFGALTLAPIVEYTIGHYPSDERAVDAAPPSALPGRLAAAWRTPWVRAFVVLPLAVAALGVLLTLFTIGAVIGFSGVVFAFAGFALVRYPLATVLALVASDVLNLLYNALQNPTITASGRSRFVTPWWADIAIQGHAIGLLAGVVCCVLLLRARDESLPSATRLWAGALLLATSQSLWAVYWYRGSTEYVLFRAVGLGIVALASILIVVAVAGPERPLWSFTDRQSSPEDPTGTTDGGDPASPDDPSSDAGPIDDGGEGGPAKDYGDPEEDPPGEQRLRDLSARQVGLASLIVMAALLSGPAVAVNLVATDGGLPGEPTTVRGYEVTYAEGIPDGLVSAIPFTAFGETTQVTTSGVIVANDDRQIWQTVVPKGRLAANGRATVVVGGVGWRDSVTAIRQGWTAVGGGTAYRVALDDGDERRTVYLSGAAQADPRIAGQNVSVAAGADSFYLLVTHENTTLREPLPGRNESVTVRNVTFRGDGSRVVAFHEGTRVTVLRAERYN